MPMIVPGITSAGTDKTATADWTNKLMGKKITDSGTSNETNFAKSDLPSKHRVVEDGGMMTMDFVPDRLNVHVGKDGIVKKITHG